MALSKTQQKVLDFAKEQIDIARTLDIKAWACHETFHGPTCIEDTRMYKEWEEYGFKSQEAAFERLREQRDNYAETYGKYYEQHKQGMALCRADSRTIKALEKQGYIRIINDGRVYVDTIEVLNY